MKQKKTDKNIVFAMKCLGIALLMNSNTNFNFDFPIPVDIRVRELTKRLGARIESDEEIRNFWNRVLSEIRSNGILINMIHLDSLVWQIGKLKRLEIVEYFTKRGLRDVGIEFSKLLIW